MKVARFCSRAWRKIHVKEVIFYSFDDDEMSIYNAVGDAVGWQISTTENVEREVK